MNKLYLLLLMLISQYSFALDIPTDGTFEVKQIDDKNILYIEHKPENGHITNTLINLVRYYLENDNDDYQVVFPSFSMSQGDKELFALEYQGNPLEKGDIKITNLKGGHFYSYIYKGSYQNLGDIISEMISRIITETDYTLNSQEVRLLYWNSIDDNHPKDLITEIQVRVEKK